MEANPRTPVFVALVMLLAFIAFSPTLKVGFMLDDAFLVPRVQSEWTFANIRRDFTTNVHDDPSTYLYRPVQKMMVRLQYSISGTRAWGYHLVSLLFHSGNAAGIFLLSLALGATPPAALLSGAFYAVHPLIVDDLLAGTGGESMAIFFGLFALYGLVREDRPWLVALGYTSYVCALFSKESSVVLPVLLALLLWVGRRPTKSYGKVIPMLLLWIPYGLMRSHVVGDMPALSPGLMARFMGMAFPRIAFYAATRVILPWDLESWPAIPHMSRLWWAYGGALLLIGGALWQRKNRWGLFAWGWFVLVFAMRAPAMILGEAVFDKWISMASIGLFIPLGVLFVDRLQTPRAGKKALWGTGLFLILLGWGALSLWNIRLRGSDEKNYAWAMRHGFRDFAAYRLSVIYLKTGRAIQTLPLMDELVERNPGNLDYANTRALAYWHAGQRSRATDLLKALLKTNPYYTPARENLLRMLPGRLRE